MYLYRMHILWHLWSKKDWICTSFLPNKTGIYRYIEATVPKDNTKYTCKMYILIIQMYFHVCLYLLVLHVKYVNFFRYVIHLYEMNVDGVWENRSIYIYYTELIFELSAISIDFCHHLHMLVSFFFLCWYLYVSWFVLLCICMYANLRDDFKN